MDPKAPLYAELKTDRPDLLARFLIEALNSAERATAYLRRESGLVHVAIAEAAPEQSSS